jgi:hypothetical protein
VEAVRPHDSYGDVGIARAGLVGAEADDRFDQLNTVLAGEPRHPLGDGCDHALAVEPGATRVATQSGDSGTRYGAARVVCVAGAYSTPTSSNAIAARM